MSLEVTGVWEAGVWATTVWADGVWYEGGSSTGTGVLIAVNADISGTGIREITSLGDLFALDAAISGSGFRTAKIIGTLQAINASIDGYDLFVASSGAIADNIIRATGGPTVNDGLAYWFSRANSETINDAERRWLISQGGSGGTIQDLWREYLEGLGYTGTLNDMMLKYWRAQ